MNQVVEHTHTWRAHEDWDRDNEKEGLMIIHKKGLIPLPPKTYVEIIQSKFTHLTGVVMRVEEWNRVLQDRLRHIWPDKAEWVLGYRETYAPEKVQVYRT